MHKNYWAPPQSVKLFKKTLSVQIICTLNKFSHKTLHISTCPMIPHQQNRSSWGWREVPKGHYSWTQARTHHSNTCDSRSMVSEMSSKWRYRVIWATWRYLMPPSVWCNDLAFCSRSLCSKQPGQQSQCINDWKWQNLPLDKFRDRNGQCPSTMQPGGWKQQQKQLVWRLIHACLQSTQNYDNFS